MGIRLSKHTEEWILLYELFLRITNLNQVCQLPKHQDPVSEILVQLPFPSDMWSPVFIPEEVPNEHLNTGAKAKTQRSLKETP